jgi:hypothetical protein
MVNNLVYTVEQLTQMFVFCLDTFQLFALASAIGAWVCTRRKRFNESISCQLLPHLPL